MGMTINSNGKANKSRMGLLFHLAVICKLLTMLLIVFLALNNLQLPAQTLPGTIAIGASASQMSTPASLRGASAPLSTGASAPLSAGSGMMFTENKGQLIDMSQQSRPDILFKGNSGGTDIFLRKTGISYVTNNAGEIMHEVDEQVEEMERSVIITEEEESEIRRDLIQKQLLKGDRIDVDFVNCMSENYKIDIQTADQIDGYTNYYYSHCPDGITRVNSYNQVTVKNIYKGIDVKYYASTLISEGTSAQSTHRAAKGQSKSGGLKYDIIVNPGADPDQILLKYSGAKEILLKNGHLVIETSLGLMGEYIPRVYQIIEGQIIDVKAGYALNGTIVGFELGAWNHEFPLIIDPWLSYYGGSLPDRGAAVATDNAGNVVFTGQTESLNFPVTAGAFQIAFRGNIDLFVVKMNVNGGRLWATYYGGTDRDYGNGIATDAADNILVSGTTSSTNFPVAGAHQGTYGGGTDGFLIKFNPAGAQLWATYYGGTAYDDGSDVASDGSNIYLYGTTYSTNAISTAGAFQTALSGTDCHLVKFLSTGTRVWGTYIGGSSDENAGGVACDATGNVIVGGHTISANFPVGFTGANVVYQNTLGGAGGDAFVFKFNTSGGRLWSTYYGGPGGDTGVSIAVDGLNNVIIAGYTDSNSGMGFNGTTQLTFGGAVDDFIAKFNSTGSALWGTYVGGLASEYFGFVATDGNNNIYILGEWEDNTPANYISSLCAYQPNPGGGNGSQSEDQFIAKYTPNGIQQCLTYLGGPDEDDLDAGGGITVNGNYLYLTGGAGEKYPVTAGAFQTAYAGPFPSSQGGDAFIDQLCINICEAKDLNPDFSVSKICPNSPVVFNPSINNSCDTSNYKYLWTFTGGTPASSTLLKPTVTFGAPGFYTGKLVVTTPCQKDSITNTIIVNSCSIDGTAAGATICQGNCANLTITGLTGTNPYIYSWSTGATTQTINVCPNTTTSYTVIVTDANGFTFAAAPIVVVRTAITTTSASSNIFNCSSGGGYISVFVTNPSGLGTLTYSWSSGETLSRIYPSVAGNYVITITDGFGCTKTNAFNIIDTRPPVSATFTYSQLCVGMLVNFTNTGSTGSGVKYSWSIAPVNVSGTTTNFSYTFLSAGSYTVSHTVTNTCSKTETQTIVVTNCVSGPSITAAASSVCPGSCATVNSTPAGGISPYTYSWSNGSTTQNISPCPVTTTTYTIKVTDSGGNSSTTTVIVSVNPAINASVTVDNINCYGGTGTLTAAGMGGTPGYTYSWSNGVSGTAVSGLTAGNYAVTITDSKGCTASSVSNVISPQPLIGQFAKGTSSCVSCGCKEWLMVSAGGGTAPYSYTWPDGYINRYKNQLCPGTYTVNIKDKNGCSVNISLTAP
ncbi:MAG: SBBP repeat-containing protein [Bacteroidia bacterium]|nr:SBBP repeat-containing protein [Bacteroidia bacterium]